MGVAGSPVLRLFFHQGDRAIFGIVLPAIKSDLQLTDSQLGLVGSVLFFMLAVMMPISGYLGDVWNKKWIITGSLVFWSAATMFTGLATGLTGLVVFRSVATAGGESFYTPAAYPLLAKHHKKTRAFAMSVHQGSLYFGVMVSGFLGGFIADRWGWRSAFYVFGGFGILLGFLFCWRLQSSPAESHGVGANVSGRSSPWMTLSLLFRTPTALLLTIGFTSIVFVNNAYIVWAPAFLREKYGLSLADAGGYAMFYHHLAALVGILVGGKISDAMVVTRPKFRLQLMCAAMFLGAPAIFFMGLASGLTFTCLAMGIFGLFRGLYESNTHAALFDVVAPQYRASAVGVMVMVAFLAGSISPWLMGHINDVFPLGQGLSYGFAALSGTYLLGGLAILCAAKFTFHKDHYKENTQ
jgi:MFS transporter, Spinster family, sphingosine-1-phosphate transporter